MKVLYILRFAVKFAFLAILAACTNKNMHSQNTPNAASIYEFKLNDIDGKPRSLSEFKGKVVVVINVASNCGYTGQYEEMETFYKEYSKKGVVVLGFPANDFMGQEPGSDAQIKQFCTKNYGVTFPMFSKIQVDGSGIHPLYAWLTTQLKTKISWNFNKIIVDKNGKPVKHFKSSVKVTDDDFLKEIQNLL